MRVRGDFMVCFADLHNPKIAFPGSPTPAELCYVEPPDLGAWQGAEGLGGHRDPGSELPKDPRGFAEHFQQWGTSLAGPWGSTRDGAPTFTA